MPEAHEPDRRDAPHLHVELGGPCFIATSLLGIGCCLAPEPRVRKLG